MKRFGRFHLGQQNCIGRALKRHFESLCKARIVCGWCTDDPFTRPEIATPDLFQQVGMGCLTGFGGDRILEIEDHAIGWKRLCLLDGAGIGSRQEEGRTAEAERLGIVI